jgi:hypothetical protein
MTHERWTAVLQLSVRAAGSRGSDGLAVALVTETAEPG